MRVSLDVNFNESLTNDVVSFEQLGPVLFTDYIRVVFAFASFYYMPSDPVKASILYIVSGLLDAIDGHLARMLNQGIFNLH